MARKKFNNEIKSIVWQKTNGYCWHCKNKINLNKWHIDHYPIRYNDIKDQLLFGITDERAISNLVPSCVKCNTSHKFEKKYYFYGGRSQCPCNISCILSGFIFLFMLIILIIYIKYNLTYINNILKLK